MNLTISIISIVVGLIGIFIGIWVIGRLAGKLRISMIFLIIAAITFVIKEVLKIFNFLITINLEIVTDVMNIAIILFILFAISNTKQMINRIDNHYKKK